MSDTDKTPLLGVDWLKTVAGALAAVSTTVLLSTLGAAGTLIGAAVGSIAATIATALYSQGLARSRAQVRRFSTTKYASARDAPTTYPARGTPPPPVPGSHSVSGRWADRLRGLPWKRLLPAALVLFLVVIAVVTAFELISGRTLASRVGGGDNGGTTISHVTNPGSGGGGTDDQAPSPTGETSPTGTATDTPSGPGTRTPTGSATPSGEATSTPSGEPTETSSPWVGPAASETPSPTIGASPSTSPSPQGQGGE